MICLTFERVSQSLPRKMTPAIFPWRIRVRNLRFGGAVSVPITTSASSLKPLTSWLCGAVVAGAEPAPRHAVSVASNAIAAPVATRLLGTRTMYPRKRRD